MIEFKVNLFLCVCKSFDLNNHCIYFILMIKSEQINIINNIKNLLLWNKQKKKNCGFNQKKSSALQKSIMICRKYSERLSKTVAEGHRSLAVQYGGFLTKFPCGFGFGFHYYKESQEYGKCYKFQHFSLTKGYVIPET